MHYAAIISREGKHVLAAFPDCPGCQTFASDGDQIAAAAREALEGWLEAHLADGQIPPRPVERDTAPMGKKLARIGVRPGLAAALLLRWAREDAGLSQKELGVLARVSQQQIAKLENPDEIQRSKRSRKSLTPWGSICIWTSSSRTESRCRPGPRRAPHSRLQCESAPGGRSANPHSQPAGRTVRAPLRQRPRFVRAPAGTARRTRRSQSCRRCCSR